MPLTHVCMWSGHGWTRITASEAARMRPGGTVSARSGLFMCDICGQYVTLTSGDIRDPYFKHSSEEKSKECPERTFGVSTFYDFKADTHDLPIRIHIIDQKSFEIEIGLIDIPTSILGKRDSRKIVIKQLNSHGQSYSYSLERLNQGTITYLSVGGIPAEKYRLSYPIEEEKIVSYWPSVIDGISPNGSLFDSFTGKKLAEDADVEVNHPYYLVTRHEKSWITGYKQVRIDPICQSTEDWLNRWNIFRVEATSYGEDPARFFLDYHARLTDCPVDLFPVWPEFVEKPYRIFHRSQIMWLYMRGEGVKSKVFPPAYISEYSQNENESFLYFNCNDRQQLVSSGRVRVLKYMYLWKDDLEFTHAKKQVVYVKNEAGDSLDSDEYNILPPKDLLHVELNVDGNVEIIDSDGFIISNRNVPAGKEMLIDNIRYSSTVRIYCGFDCVWSASFVRKESIGFDADEDKKLISQLDAYCEDKIPIGHAVGGMANKLSGRDDLKAWIAKQIRTGEISRKALRILTTKIGGNSD